MTSARLVTLVGPGGVGKTRLAHEVANRQRPNLAEGAWFIDLRLAGRDRAVGSVTASGLGLRADTSINATEQIAQFVADRSLLIVLDNCDHVLDEAAVLVEALFGAPGLTILATSREPLDIAGEHLVRLDPLDCDGPRSPAVKLFVERARLSPKD